MQIIRGMQIRIGICCWLVAWLLLGCNKIEPQAPFTTYAGGRVSLRLAAIDDSLEISVLNDTGLTIAVNRLLPISGPSHEVSLRLDGEVPNSAIAENQGDPDLVDPTTLAMNIRPNTFYGKSYSWPDIARFYGLQPGKCYSVNAVYEDKSRHPNMFVKRLTSNSVRMCVK